MSGFSNFIQNFGALVGALSLIGIGWRCYLWGKRPRLSAGIIPIWELQKGLITQDDLGRKASRSEYDFNKEWLAVDFLGTADLERRVGLLKGQMANGVKTKEGKMTHCRRVGGKTLSRHALKGRELDIPIVIKNDGTDNARDFEVMISFRAASGTVRKARGGRTVPEIKIMDFAMEDMAPKEICADPRFYAGNLPGKYREAMLEPSLYSIYERIGVVENTVSAKGELEGKSFTIMRIKLFVPQQHKEFIVAYQFDSGQDFVEQSFQAQYVTVA